MTTQGNPDKGAGSVWKAYKERLTEQKGKAPVKRREVRAKLQEIYDFLWILLQSTLMLIQIKSSIPISVTILNAIRSRYKKTQNWYEGKAEAVGSAN